MTLASDAQHTTEGEFWRRALAWYPGAIIIAICAGGFVPLAVFLFEIWPRHGLASLVPVALGWGAGVVLNRALPAWYFHVAAFEAGGRVYEAVGVRRFKRIVPGGDYTARLARRYEAGANHAGGLVPGHKTSYAGAAEDRSTDRVPRRT